MKYADKLKDPRWQKKRLEILSRDKFKCRSCGSKKKTLHVHHMTYMGKEPWDSDTDDLMTLCECCHKLLHLILDIGYDICAVYEVVDMHSKWQDSSIMKYLANPKRREGN